MKKLESLAEDAALQEKLEKSGLRTTPQRQQVYRVLLEKRDHPTAEEVFIRAKKGMPDISIATVYNCLDALVNCGLVRQVNQDREATRYCSNMRQHHHFYCVECGGAYDIDLTPGAPPVEVPLPKGFEPAHFEVNVRGLCAECAVHARK